MTTSRFVSVLGAIEDTRSDAQNMKPRSALMTTLKNHFAPVNMATAVGLQVEMRSTEVA